MSYEEMSRDHFEARASLRLNEFTDVELAWSAEVARQNIESAESNGAGKACLDFWKYLKLLFLNEIDSRRSTVCI